MKDEPFWETVKLVDMNDAQWEAVCDGCAKCCLIKLQDEENGDIVFTDIVCHLLDGDTCRCSRYDARTELVPSCVKLTKENLHLIDFMPPSCAYRLLNEGKKLPDWHPLISGTATTVVDAGMSVRGRVMSELAFDGDWETRVVDWPLAIKK